MKIAYEVTAYDADGMEIGETVIATTKKERDHTEFDMKVAGADSVHVFEVEV
jgi:hypothetical protein